MRKFICNSYYIQLLQYAKISKLSLIKHNSLNLKFKEPGGFIDMKCLNHEGENGFCFIQFPRVGKLNDRFIADENNHLRNKMNENACFSQKIIIVIFDKTLPVRQAEYQ